MKTVESFLDKKQIYCDLDGVLCDFSKQVESFGYGTWDDIEDKYGPEFIWPKIIKKGVSFWSEMPWTEDGKDLWSYIKKYDPIILSAPINHDSSREGKKIWVKKHLGPNVKLILEFAKNKHIHSNSSSILIDDSERNIKDWKEKNGIGIFHTSAKRSIAQLKKVIGD